MRDDFNVVRGEEASGSDPNLSVRGIRTCRFGPEPEVGKGFPRFGDLDRPMRARCVTPYRTDGKSVGACQITALSDGAHGAGNERDVARNFFL